MGDRDATLAAAWFNLGNKGGGAVAQQHRSVKDCYIQALTFDANHRDAWLNLGFAGGGGRVSGQHYNKQQCYAKALTLDPQSAMAWNNFGFAGGGDVNGQHYNKQQC